MDGNVVKGFKVFNKDWTCLEKQYTCPGKFEEDVIPRVCSAGMHFCKKAVDCFNYYPFDPEKHVAEVVAYGEIEENGNKCCTNKLEIVREIPWTELLEIMNMGKACTGFCNSGDWNSGFCNSGNRNSGNWNSGDCNSGNRNSGDCNSGNWNSGNRNSGSWNSGDCNSGFCNSGNWNSGNRNSGNWNSGDWNKTSFSNGCFNTRMPKIHLFNKPSEWTYEDWCNSQAYYLLNGIDSMRWIWACDMTDEEKAAHPEYETTGGYLKECELHDSARLWWKGLDPSDREIILAIPNFDKAIFEEITGVDVDDVSEEPVK